MHQVYTEAQKAENTLVMILRESKGAVMIRITRARQKNSAELMPKNPINAAEKTLFNIVLSIHP